MRFISIKTVDQQALLTLHRVRQALHQTERLEVQALG
jgi:hypothetical protein